VGRPSFQVSRALRALWLPLAFLTVTSHSCSKGPTEPGGGGGPDRSALDQDIAAAVAFLGITDWRFVGPIFIGDTIFVNYVLTELRDSASRPTQAIATFDVELVNQDGGVAQRDHRSIIRRPRSPARPAESRSRRH
jgi:hypothetical protein